jgi:hypothetical protein
MRTRLLTALAALAVVTMAVPVAASSAGHPVVQHHCKGCPTEK